MITLRRILFTFLFLLTGIGAAIAGSLDAPAPPTSSAGAMFTSNDLYNRLTSGAAGVKRTGPFAEPTAPPGPTGHTDDEIMAVMPAADNSNGATVGEVLSGKSFWGLRSDGTWGFKVGTMPVQALSPASMAVPAGYYAATNLATVDPDLVSANIRSGVSIFGVNGKGEVVDTAEVANPAGAGQILAGRKAFVNGAAVIGTVATGANVSGGDGLKTFVIPDGIYSTATTATANDANLISGNIKSGATIFGVVGSYAGGGSSVPIPVGKTGQTIVFQAGDDGTWQKGVLAPSPRFTDNLNGTVTDNATGLIWLKNANCFGAQNWSTAITLSNTLASGACGLSDGSTFGQWRLSNIKELLSLIDYAHTVPALPTGHPFSNVASYGWYWSSTDNHGDVSHNTAWPMFMGNGDVGDGGGGSVVNKSSSIYMWPVRGGQL